MRSRTILSIIVFLTTASVILLAVQTALYGTPVAEYMAEEGDGTVVGDTSGWGNNAYFVGQPIWQTGHGAGSLHCLNFDGSNYLEVSDSTSLDSITTKFTMTAWIKADQDSINDTIVWKLGAFRIWKDNASLKVTLVGVSTVQNVTVLNGISNGVWHHVAVIYNGQWLKCYLDGAKVYDSRRNSSDVSISASNNPLRIGWYNGGPPYYRGLLDNVRLYNNALLEAEVTVDMGSDTVMTNANSAPVVSNISVIQRNDSKMVDISYSLSDADGDKCTVSVQVSNDGGSTWTVHAVSFTGEVGSNISSGNGKLIVWDAGKDLPGVSWDNCMIKLTAYDVSSIPNMVYIPAGTFSMGDIFSEGDSDERPVHSVTLDAYYMGKYEITNQQYCDFLNSAKAQNLISVTSNIVYKYGLGTSYPYCDTYQSSTYSQINWNGSSFTVRTKSGRSMGNDPVVNVSWDGSVAYCNWLSQQQGKEQCYNLSTWACDFNKKGYRLATEAEWERAARGGLSSKRFPWGDTINQTQANFYSNSYYSYDVSPVKDQCHPLWNDGVRPFTSPVGFFDGTLKYKSNYNWSSSLTSYQTANGGNNYGLYDMAGNVWEWCNDWDSSSYYGSIPSNNPTGPTSGAYRVLRGGSWYDFTYGCRVADRGNVTPSDRYDRVGFRLVLDF